MAIVNKKVCFELFNYPAVKQKAEELNWTLSKLINFCILTFMYDFDN